MDECWGSFKSYKELEEKIKTYEQSNSVQLWKREARTVTSANKRVDSLRIDESGCHLVVTSTYSEHNHPVSQDLYKHLPRQKRLPEALKTQGISNSS
ncbi:uncharacterized protein LOC121366150 [Gigantopelta aegis]|uniref:uncharacterized protein LOC121366150 n=1 Tax=Gigantopelta aegis TaxID=1735272 RepID=UPI001B88B151|nr:uncharacterized protein LOC121366150 [Gigantopelta aegis]